MQVYTVLRPITAIVVFLAILLNLPSVSAGQETADWWKAQRDVTVTLMERGTAIAEVVEDVSTSTPTSGQEAMFKLSVLMRGGINEQTIEALRQLKAFCPRLDNYQVASIYHYACDAVHAWGVAKATVEVFADNISEIALDNRILEHFLNSGWTVEKVDEWLAGMPKGGRNFWVKERLLFNMKHGRGDALAGELSDSVREHPENIENAVAFLDALVYARHSGQQEYELAWMAEAIKPERATQAHDLASRLKHLKNWMTAVTFYRQAIKTELTDQEVRHLGMMCAAFVPPKRLCAMFAAHTREGMAECLLKLGKKNQAQKWMVEAADIREKHNLGLNALFAGQVQAASGQRIIEGRIRQEEKESEDDSQYWWERAQYYRGRREPAQEEEALRKGLALTAPKPEPKRRRRGHVDWRSWLLSDYAHFLARESRTGEAVTLLREEMESSPANSVSSKKAAHVLAFDFEKHIRVEDKVLWNWLAKRPKWEYTEERVLWRMLESAKQDDLDRYFSRAEKLADGSDPSRSHTVGWIMNRMNFPKRSIPLLKYAVENADDKELKERAGFTLFESYLDTGDWEHAEEVFPDAAKRLTPKELPEWYSRVAVTAAKAGAKTDAMRIWSRVANLSPSQIGSLEDLAKAGLRNELKDFYCEMRKKMPSSEVPTRAMMVLEKN